MENKELYVHTWYGDLYCGSVSMTYLDKLFDDPDSGFLHQVDKEGKLAKDGEFTYVDFEGVTVTHKLKGYEDAEE
ncbi:hypothetical protein ACRXCV_00270 (plasmid) [Halobacteriovorax sp. GFR7]|uniref:hypothetical protein n=1 Tax=unclassified Halobacteriovorax TaxID=2639665 RepID=UPI003D9666B4